MRMLPTSSFTASRRRGALVLLAWAALAATAFAQAPAANDPAQNARIRFGPFFLQPTVAITNAGVDTNVFNSNDQPERDYTITIVPAVLTGFLAGPVRLTVLDRTEYVWYQRFTSERSLNGTLNGRFEVRWNRFRPWVQAEASKTRARSGDEIDIRARRSAPLYAAGAEFGVASRTWITAEVRRMSTSYGAGEQFLGVDLARALNNTSDSAAVGLKLELTPLTTFTLLGRLERVRFDSATFRDSDNYILSGSFTFDPDALLAGQAMVGYRDLRAKSAAVTDFRGAIASINLVYDALPNTRFSVNVNRDIAYSFEDLYPYYVTTNIRVTATQRIAGPFEVVGRARRDWLDYSPLAGLAPARTDRIDDYGAGIGFRFGIPRLGFDVERIERRSPVTARQYQGTRYFGSLTYEF
jgi:hypothetical protein